MMGVLVDDDSLSRAVTAVRSDEAANVVPCPTIVMAMAPSTPSVSFRTCCLPCPTAAPDLCLGPLWTSPRREPVTEVTTFVSACRHFELAHHALAPRPSGRGARRLLAGARERLSH